MEDLSDQALTQIAQYFQALAEPTRLRIINALRSGERNVSELTEICGCSTANVSRHLAVLASQGIVVRESRGTSVYYDVGETKVYALCDLVCGSIAREFEKSSAIQLTINAAALKGKMKARKNAR